MQLFRAVTFLNSKIRVFREGAQDEARLAYSFEASQSIESIHSTVTVVQFVFHRCC